jgi:hypothetical protein
VRWLDVAKSSRTFSLVLKQLLSCSASFSPMLLVRALLNAAASQLRARELAGSLAKEKS